MAQAGLHLEVWVAEVLDLGLGELTHAQQTGAGGDLVTVRVPNLRCGMGGRRGKGVMGK